MCQAGETCDPVDGCVGQCQPKGGSCSSNSDCCSNRCRRRQGRCR
jgi:hypothetical protein